MIKKVDKNSDDGGYIKYRRDAVYRGRVSGSCS